MRSLSLEVATEGVAEYSVRRGIGDEGEREEVESASTSNAD